jgi:hypothetical protein
MEKRQTDKDCQQKGFTILKSI